MNKVEHIFEGNHGDHWAGVFGVDNWYRKIAPADVQGPFGEYMAVVSYAGEVSFESEGYTVRKKEEDGVELKLIQKGGQMASFYPSIKTDIAHPSRVIEVRPWMHVDGIEAQMLLACYEKFAVYAFLTDYLENRDTYLGEEQLQMKLSAIALTVQTPPVGPQFPGNFIGHMINQEYMAKSIFDYVGEVKSIQQVKHLGIEGRRVGLRLAEEDGNRDYFNIHLFIHQENMHIEDFGVGDRIAGMLWFHAELADDKATP